MKSKKVEYPKLSKDQWMGVVESSLKSTSMDSFEWVTGPGLKAKVFAHQEDIDDLNFLSADQQQGNHWKVGWVQQISKQEQEGSHSEDALMINVSEGLEEMPGLFKHVHLIASRPEDVEDLMIKAEDKLIEGQHLALELDNIFTYTPKHVVRIMDMESEGRWIVLPVNIDGNNPDPIQELGTILTNYYEWLAKVEDEDTLNTLLKNTRFCYRINNADFLFWISCFKALRTLWYNFQSAYEVEIGECVIDAEILFEELAENEEQQLILATIASSAAVIGGVDVLYLNAKTRVEEKNLEIERLAKNIQLILKEESGMGHVVDPIKGAYAIEDLTRQMASNSWKHFQSRI